VTAQHLSSEQLESGLPAILESPADIGVVRMIVRRPEEGQREVVEHARLDTILGLIGDNWKSRGNRRTPDGQANPDAQITLMNSRVAALVAQQQDRWRLAGDQLYIDMDLRGANLPPGTRLAVGSAVIEVTALPHIGCARFVERFGLDAMKFVNSTSGREMNLRGINAKIVRAGSIRVKDLVTKI
jgi:hypothetical protein